MTSRAEPHAASIIVGAESLERVHQLVAAALAAVGERTSRDLAGARTVLRLAVATLAKMKGGAP